jgi:hypothetical protein
MKQIVAVKRLTPRLSARDAAKFLREHRPLSAMLWMQTVRNGKGRTRKRYVVVEVVPRRKSVLPGRSEIGVPNVELIPPEFIG